MSAEIAERAVNSGFDVLQEEDPSGEWMLKVDMGALHMLSYSMCVLGYVYGDYLRGLAFLRPDFVGDGRWIRDTGVLMPGEMIDWAASHGFAIPDGASPVELHDAWIAKLTSAIRERHGS